MRINKALVKHETKNMKWMMLYFLLVAIAGVLYFNTNLDGKYIQVLTHGLTPNVPVVLEAIRRIIDMIVLPIGIGILLMIYLQFKDSKSVEVGNFLKSLPISNREFYVTKLIGGLISLTVPTIVLIAGVLLIRANNMSWISDIHSISLFAELIIKGDSVINITSILIMTYMVAVSTYTFLFMIQYIVMNITAGLVIGSLVWLSPMFIIGSIVVLYGGMIEKVYPMMEKRYVLSKMFEKYIQPWMYPMDPSQSSPLAYTDASMTMESIDNMYFMFYDGILIKIGITLAIAIASVAVGYILSNKSRVEDSDSFISFKWARRVFVIGVTLCSAFLAGDALLIFLGGFNPIGFVPLQIVIVIGGFIGFIFSKKITSVKAKQGGII